MIAIAREDGVPERNLRLIQPRGNTYNPAFFPDGIVGLADLEDVFGPDDDTLQDHPAAASPWAHEQANYWLHLTNVAQVTAVEYPGAVGLFKVPYDTVTSLRPLIPA